MPQYENFSQDEFAGLIRRELAAYYSALGTRQERLFFFEGQDPFGHELPAEAISSLYWSLSGARDRVIGAIVDLLVSRPELLPRAALSQVVTAIGLIQRPDTLEPMARAIGQRGETTGELRGLFASAVMVLKGFGPMRSALNASRLLVGFPSFPNDLVYDVLDILIRDPDLLWSKSVLDLQARMYADYQPIASARITTRLAYAAREIAARVALPDFANGLAKLVDSYWSDAESDDSQYRPITSQSDPMAILITQLVLAPNAPYEISPVRGGRVRLAVRDNPSLEYLAPGTTGLSRLIPRLVANRQGGRQWSRFMPALSPLFGR